MILPLFAASVLVGAAFIFLLAVISSGSRPEHKPVFFSILFVLFGLFCSWLGSFILPTWSSWNSGLVVKAWSALGSAGSEEILKTGFWIVATSCMRSLKRPRDGLLQGASLGIGFALGENILFGLASGWHTWILRTVISLPGHIAYGATWGGFWAWSQISSKTEKTRHFANFLGVWLLVIALHGLYNLASEAHFPLVVLLSLDGFAWALALASGILVWNYRQISRSPAQVVRLRPVV